MEREWKILNVISITIFHLISICSIPYVLYYSKNLSLTILWIIIYGQMAGFGVTAGVHRYWCHKTYKTKLFFQYLLAIFYSMAGQNTILDWVRDHRVHHKFSDTDGDPHNIENGFWFSHVGWLMMKKHSKVIANGKQLDMSDLLNDPVVMWHTKNFKLLKFLFCFLIPTIIPIFIWNEYLSIAILSQVFIRYCISLNFTWLVNSAAHMWGIKPYNKNIYPTDNKLISLFSLGEGYHNYHHTFPYDYKAAEFGFWSFTTAILNILKYLNIVYDTKEAPIDYVKNKKQKN